VLFPQSARKQPAQALLLDRKETDISIDRTEVPADTTPSCAGINLGYGHLKMATDMGTFITASAFAPHNKLYDGVGRARDTHKVVLDASVYEVGADVITLARAKETVRIPEPKWLGTLRYRIFAQRILDRLALENTAWHLVLGMPIADFEDTAYRQRLESFWVGTHDTASGPIRILNARAVPEPIGALFSESTFLNAEEGVRGAMEQGSQLSSSIKPSFSRTVPL